MYLPFKHYHTNWRERLRYIEAILTFYLFTYTYTTILPLYRNKFLSLCISCGLCEKGSRCIPGGTPSVLLNDTHDLITGLQWVSNPRRSGESRARYHLTSLQAPYSLTIRSCAKVSQTDFKSAKLILNLPKLLDHWSGSDSYYIRTRKKWAKISDQWPSWLILVCRINSEHWPRFVFSLCTVDTLFVVIFVWVYLVHLYHLFTGFLRVRMRWVQRNNEVVMEITKETDGPGCCTRTIYTNTYG